MIILFLHTLRFSRKVSTKFRGGIPVLITLIHCKYVYCSSRLEHKHERRGSGEATAFLGYEAIKCRLKNTKVAEPVSDITIIPIVVDSNVSTNRM
jgi:hypothetical protein